MKTMSFKIKVNEELEKVISEDSRIYSSMFRFAFNRHREGLSKKEIYAKVNETFSDVNCHLRSGAQGEAKWKFLSIGSDASKKVHFGQFKRFQRGLISKEEFKQSRDCGIFSGGEANQRGNRLFQIDVENSEVVYKRSRREHHDLVVAEKLNGKRKGLLKKLQVLMSEKKIPVTFRLKSDKIYISYDEKVVEK